MSLAFINSKIRNLLKLSEIEKHNVVITADIHDSQEILMNSTSSILTSDQAFLTNFGKNNVKFLVYGFTYSWNISDDCDLTEPTPTIVIIEDYTLKRSIRFYGTNKSKGTNTIIFTKPIICRTLYIPGLTYSTGTCKRALTVWYSEVTDIPNRS